MSLPKIIKRKIRTHKRTSGFTIIEALVFLFIFSVITLTFYAVFTLGANYIINAKNRLGALAVAREKMEIVRNLKYEDVGTTTGAVTGILPEDEDVAENTRTYHIHTNVEYIDDDFDGVYPDDPAWEDYKKVTVTVSWSGGSISYEAKMVSRFTPVGLETASPDHGILIINVFSDQPGGSGIPNSAVHVVNSSTGLDTTVYTDGTGKVILMGDKIRESIYGYEIGLSKSGHETVSTLPPYPDTDYDPVDVHASVVLGTVNVANIVQNKLAYLEIMTTDHLGDTAVPNIDFHLEGGRRMGTTVSESDPPDPVYPVYNIDNDEQTNSSGKKDFGSVSPGQYVFTLPETFTDYVLIDADPVSPFPLYSEDDITVKAKLASTTFSSYLARIKWNVEGELAPIAGAQVRLYNGTDYDVTLTASSSGTAFFPQSADPLPAGTYNLKVTADGFGDHNSQITVETDQLKEEDIELTPL